MSEKLASLDSKLLATGLHLGVPPLDVPFWQDARNVLFDTTGVHTEHGFEQVVLTATLFDDKAGLFDSGAGLFDDGGGAGTPLDIGASVKITGLLQQFLNNGGRQVIIGTGSNLYRYTGGATPSVGAGYTNNSDESDGRLATYWSLVNFGDWVVATNGREQVQLDKGAGFANLTGSPPSKAEVVRKIATHVLLFNTNAGFNAMHWCADSNVEDWDPVSDPTAGNILIQELSNPIICAEPLGNLGLGVYTRSEMIVVQYLGGTFTFGQRLAQRGIGAASKNSIVPLGGIHYGISPLGIWATDGGSMQVLSEPNVGDWLGDNVNWDQQSKIAGYSSLVQGVIRWSVPAFGASEPNIVICFNTRTKQFSLSELVFTVGLEKSVLRYPIVGRHGGRVDLAESTANDRGAAISKYLITKPLDLGEPSWWKYLDTITVKGEIESGMGPRVWVRELVDTSPNTILNAPWTGPFVLDNLMSKFIVRANGPFIQLKFDSIAVNEDWKLASMELWGSISGKDW